MNILIISFRQNPVWLSYVPKIDYVSYNSGHNINGVLWFFTNYSFLNNYLPSLPLPLQCFDDFELAEAFSIEKREREGGKLIVVPIFLARIDWNMKRGIWYFRMTFKKPEIFVCIHNKKMYLYWASDSSSWCLLASLNFLHTMVFNFISSSNLAFVVSICIWRII